MQPIVLRACLAGFTGTILVALMMSFVSPYMSGGAMDIAIMAGGFLGGSWIAEVTAHLLVGAFALPVLYALVFLPRLGGAPLVGGLAWGLLLWLLSQAIVMPMLGWGFFSAEAGGLVTVTDSLIGHLVHGLVFGLLVGSPMARAVRERHAIRPEAHAARGLGPH